MTHRQYTELTVSVTVPIPAGWTQAFVLEKIKSLMSEVFSNSALVKLTAKKTTYHGG